MNSTIYTVIDSHVKQNRIVVYMKGSPELPRCGFSKDVIGVLDHLGVKYLSFDVLDNPELREAIKEYGKWPTIPQVYIDGVLVGGCDILLEMYRDGSLQKLIGVA